MDTSSRSARSDTVLTGRHRGSSEAHWPPSAPLGRRSNGAGRPSAHPGRRLARGWRSFRLPGPTTRLGWPAVRPPRRTIRRGGRIDFQPERVDRHGRPDVFIGGRFSERSGPLSRTGPAPGARPRSSSSGPRGDRRRPRRRRFPPRAGPRSLSGRPSPGRDPCRSRGR
jgi:hypothetical protein